MVKIFNGTDEEWDQLVAAGQLYSGALLQSSLWAKVQQARGNVCVRLVDGNGAPSLWVALPIMPFIWVWYCPKGPRELFKKDEWGEVVSTLQKIKHAAILRIEPVHDFEMNQGALIFKRRADVSASNTLLTPILKNTDELFKSFHEKTRYNIRVAQKHGIVVKKISKTELPEFEDRILDLYSMTGNRHEISETPRKDLRALFEVADVWAAFSGDKIVATSIHIGFGAVMTYLHGASDYEFRSQMAPYALHWAALQDAAERGFELYDWWGTAPPNALEHRLIGVTRFKLGFGGELTASPGTFDAGIDRMRFGLYTALRRLMRP